MNYKDAKIKYGNELKERERLILTEVCNIKKELQQVVDTKNNSIESRNKIINEANCSVCGLDKFILKYRDVNGHVEGNVSGYFSLFSGSIRGSVSGDISTAPILSCRNCGNERKIVISKLFDKEDIWRSNSFAIYRSLNSKTDASNWMKSKSLEALRIIDKEFYHLWDSDNFSKFTDKELSKVGLYNKYPVPKKPKWYNFILN